MNLDIFSEKPGQRNIDNLPDIAGYDNNIDANALTKRVFNKDKFTRYYRITDNNRQGNSSIETNRAIKQT